jgi:hypothetical protein
VPAAFRSAFGRVLSVVVWVICAAGLTITVFEGVSGVPTVLPWLALAAGAMWLMFWNPRVVVDDLGVHLINVVRTIDVPWTAITEVDTRWALTLVTPGGRYTAWAVPAPGNAGSARRKTGTDRADLPPLRKELDPVRRGDRLDTLSGAAAFVVRRKWLELRDSGRLTTPEPVVVRWHWASMAVGAGLAAVCLLVGVL